MALQFAKKYNGDFISVSDREIVESIPILGKLTGVFGEPAGVASLSGLIKMVHKGKIKEDEKIVVSYDHTETEEIEIPSTSRIIVPDAGG